MKKIAFVACSNPLKPEQKVSIEQLKDRLRSLSVEVVESTKLYTENGLPIGEGRQRAEIVNAFFRDETIDGIFDLSGGDMANEVLPFLDYDAIAKSRAMFWGYSDLTTVINAIYARTGKESVLFQLRNIISDETGEQQKRFEQYLNKEQELFQTKWIVLQGNVLQGDALQGDALQGDVLQEDALQGNGIPEEMMKQYGVVGGNIRCFLKLAGTQYFPDTSGKLLFLEALGGELPQMATYCASLHQLGVFERINGLLLGTFTHLEQAEGELAFYNIVKQYLPKDMFVAKTQEIGHGEGSRALVIGKLQ